MSLFECCPPIEGRRARAIFKRHLNGTIETRSDKNEKREKEPEKHTMNTNAVMSRPVGVELGVRPM